MWWGEGLPCDWRLGGAGGGGGGGGLWDDRGEARGEWSAKKSMTTEK